MATVQQSIEVKVPVHEAYNQLTRFEAYSHFMEDVESVQKLDDTHWHWTTRMTNRPLEWDAEITEDEPDRCIAWHNTSGPTQSGRVEVQPLAPDRTQVTFTLQLEPEQLPGSIAGYNEQALAMRLKHDLLRFRDLIEQTNKQDGQSLLHGGSASDPAPMRHMGELPQDTSMDSNTNPPTSDSAGWSGAGRRVVEGTTVSAPAGQPSPANGQRATGTGSGHEPAARVVGAHGGTDAAAGAGMAGGPGPDAPGLRQNVDAERVPGTPGGMLEGEKVSPAAGAGAAGRTGLSETASGADTRTGTGTTSGSGTALTGGGMSGGRDAGKGSAG